VDQAASQQTAALQCNSKAVLEEQEANDTDADIWLPESVFEGRP
jgi:hypothetical protein